MEILQMKVSPSNKTCTITIRLKETTLENLKRRYNAFTVCPGTLNGYLKLILEREADRKR